MTKAEFIKNMEELIADLKAENFKFIKLSESVHIFANRNFGEVWVEVTNGCNISVKLYTSTDEEKTDLTSWRNEVRIC